MATAEQSSANSTAWSLKKSIVVASFPSQSQAPMASARADSTHKLPPHRLLTGCVRVGELEVRERRPEVARRRRLDLPVEHGHERAERLDSDARLLQVTRLELRVRQRRERRE